MYTTIKDNKFTGNVADRLTDNDIEWATGNGVLWCKVDTAPVDLNPVVDGETHIADYGTPTAEQIFAAKAFMIEWAIDTLIDSVAEAKGYGTASMSPTAACISYAGYINAYQAEAVTFGEWKASIWPIVYQIQMDVVAGSRPEPTINEVLSELPAMVWPV